MSLNQRISPNLSETSGKQQAQACRQDGFTLIELLVVIAILGILMAISSGAWSSYREATRVDSAKEKVVSVLQQARLKALSSGFQQDVLLDWTNDTITYSVNGSPVVFTLEQGIDIAGYRCTAPVAASLTDVSTFKFKRSGAFSVSTLPSGKRPRTVRITSPSSAKVFYVNVNNVTGRVSVMEACP